MPRTPRIAVLSLVLVPLASSFGQQVYELAANSNAAIYERNPDEIGPDALRTGNYYASGRFWSKVGLIKFDLSCIPSNVAVTSAHMWLHILSETTNDPLSSFLAVDRVNGVWNSSTVTWNTRPTWTNNQGGFRRMSDYQDGQWVEWDVTQWVQNWRAGTPNYGVALHLVANSSGTAWNQYNFDTLAGTPAYRPRLIINATNPPAPTILTMSISGGAAFVTDDVVPISYSLLDCAVLPSHSMLSENPGFVGANWSPAVMDPTWTFTSYGRKTVYMKVKNNWGESNVQSDLIDYVPPLELQLYRVSDLIGTPHSTNPGAAKSVFARGETARVTLRARNTGSTSHPSLSANWVLNMALPGSHGTPAFNSDPAPNNNPESNIPPDSTGNTWVFRSFDWPISTNTPTGGYDLLGAIRLGSDWNVVVDDTQSGANTIALGPSSWLGSVLTVAGPPIITLTVESVEREGVATDSFLPREQVTVKLRAQNAANGGPGRVRAALDVFGPENVGRPLVFSGSSSPLDIPAGGSTVFAFSFPLPDLAKPGYYRVLGAVRNEAGTVVYDTTGPAPATEDWSEAARLVKFSTEPSLKYGTKGVTILLHGYWPGFSSFDPINDYWRDCATSSPLCAQLLEAHGKGRVYIYNPATGSFRWDNRDEFAPYDDPLGEIVLVHDWGYVSSAPRAGEAEAAAEALLAAMTLGLPYPDQRALIDLVRPNDSPHYHIIGHSRGASVASELVQRLGVYGINVDYVTYLDPHDWNEGRVPPPSDDVFHDPAVQVWTTTSYVDNYYQVSDQFLVPSGRPLAQLTDGFYWQQNLTGVLHSDGCGLPNTTHSDVVRWYFGTVAPGTQLFGWYPGEVSFGFGRRGYEFGFSRWVSHGGYDAVTPPNGIQYAADPLCPNGTIQPYPEGSDGDDDYAPPTLFMGDFDLPDVDAVYPSDAIAGWSYHGGGGHALVPSDRDACAGGYLRLERDNNRYSRTHDRVYVPASATHIRFRERHATGNQRGDELVIFMSDNTTDYPLGALPIDGGVADWVIRALRIPTECRNATRTLTFEVSSAGQCRVDIDDIGFLETATDCPNKPLLPVLLVSSRTTEAVQSLDVRPGTAGAILRRMTDAGSALDYPNGIALDDSGDFYVASVNNDRVLKYDPRAGLVTKTYSGGGLDGPDGVLIDGAHLLISSYYTNSVKMYDLQSGAFIRDFVPPGAGGLSGPGPLIRYTNGNIVVSSQNSNRVLQFDRETGAFKGDFTSSTLSTPYGLLLDDRGNLLVASYGNSSVVKFDGSGHPSVFVLAGNGGLSHPTGLAWSADGNLLVCSYGSGAILTFCRRTGNSLGSFATGSAVGLPTHILFGWVCSEDRNNNGVPDLYEAPPCSPCDTDCNGTVNQFDIVPFINTLISHVGCSPCAADTNANGTANAFDIQGFLDCLIP